MALPSGFVMPPQKRSHANKTATTGTHDHPIVSTAELLADLKEFHKSRAAAKDVLPADAPVEALLGENDFSDGSAEASSVTGKVPLFSHGAVLENRV